jgi:hypothetical protein
MLLGGLAALLIAGAGGCSNAKQGALSGAAVGALSGLAIGSLTGDAGAGAAIGAVVGGVGGAVIGDQNRRKAENATASGQTGAGVSSAGSSSAVAAADQDREILSRLAGRWSISGWSEVVASDRRDLRGTAEGSVEQNYFLRLDVSLGVDPTSGQAQSGTLIFASEPGRGMTLSSRFSDAPSTSRFVGSSSSDGRSLTLDEVDSTIKGIRRRVVIRFFSDDEWLADVSNAAAAGSPRLGSFRFTR